MNTNLLITFIIFNIINVIIQTIKSIATVKCGKVVASLVNAVAYGLYTYIVVLTVCDLPMWLKVLVVGGANLVGVFIVKLVEEKSRKDKLWLVKITIPLALAEQAKNMLEQANISFTHYDLAKYVIFDTFCEKQAETVIVTNICSDCHGKMFATENKLGL